MIKSIKTALMAGAAMLALGSAAQAHTIAYGFENAGTSAVTIWFGSYHFLDEANADGEPNEGFLQIQGINGNPFPLTSLDFDLATGTEPSGITYGYVEPGPPGGGIFLWQGVTFNAVEVGDYSFFFNPNASLGGNPATSQVFEPWNSTVQNGTFTLTDEVVQPPDNVPDGGSTVALFSAGVLGLAGVKRLQKKRGV